MLEHEVDEESGSVSIENRAGGINFQRFQCQGRWAYLREFRLQKLMMSVSHKALELRVFEMPLGCAMKCLIPIRIAGNRRTGMNDDADHLKLHGFGNGFFRHSSPPFSVDVLDFLVMTPHFLDDAVVLLVRHVRDVEKQEVGIADDIGREAKLIGGINLDIGIKELEFALPVRMPAEKDGI